jgi:hypothetical protein
MHESGKLILTGLGALLAGLAAAALWRTVQVPEAARPDAPPPGSSKARWAELARGAPVPAEIERTRRYLEERWGHLGQAGLAALSTDSSGDLIVIDPEPKPGIDGRGERIWALGYYRARKWNGAVARYGDGFGRPGATAPLSDFAPAAQSGGEKLR